MTWKILEKFGWKGGKKELEPVVASSKGDKIMAKQVFISHSDKDRTSAEKICSLLESKGITCWIAPRDLTPGRDYGEEIITAIESTSVMVLVLSTNSNTSKFVIGEVERAFSKEKTVIPFRIHEIEPSKALELFIGGTHWIDAWNPPIEIKVNLLADTILKYTGMQEVGERKKEEPVPQSSEHPDTAAFLNNLAELYRAQGRYAEAEPLYKRALAIREKALGSEHPGTAASLNNLAELYRAQGKYAEAEPLIRRALVIREKALGSEHPDKASSLNNLAGLYKAQGKYAEAEPLYKRALAIYEKALGSEHPGTAASLNNLTELYYAQGKYAETEPLYKRALTIYEKALGSEHPGTAASLNNLAGLYKAQGRYAEAEPLYKRALAIYEKALGSEHPNTRVIRENLKACHEAMR